MRSPTRYHFCRKNDDETAVKQGKYLGDRIASQISDISDAYLLMVPASFPLTLTHSAPGLQTKPNCMPFLAAPSFPTAFSKMS